VSRVLQRLKRERRWSAFLLVLYASAFAAFHVLNVTPGSTTEPPAGATVSEPNAE
jgi:hypothetical protein